MLSFFFHCCNFFYLCNRIILYGFVYKRFCQFHSYMSINFLFSTKVNFPANNLNFHWRWLDWIQAIFLNLFYFLPPAASLSASRSLARFFICASREQTPWCLCISARVPCEYRFKAYLGRSMKIIDYLCKFLINSNGRKQNM